MPAYIVFSDAALRDMARKRPSTPEAFIRVTGVGEKKLEQYGEVILDAIISYCRDNDLPTDIFAGLFRPAPKGSK